MSFDAAPLPSRFQPPQRCSADRRRARAATLHHKRQAYRYAPWDPDEEIQWEGETGWLRDALPPKLATVPEVERFANRKRLQFARSIFDTKLNGGLSKLFNPRSKMLSFHDYASLYHWITPPRRATLIWQSDLDFAEQRINGCNPMVLARVEGGLDDGLVAAADDVLSTMAPGWTCARAASAGRLFAVDYSALEALAPLIDPRYLHGSPTALFFAREDGALAPLCIRLWALGREGPNEPITPNSGAASWALAKACFQVIDGGYHEGVSHLLETHLVIEVIAVATHRQLHPDHPIFQLLVPHYLDNLALDALARTSLINRGGPIDRSMAIGAKGAIAAVAASWQDWDFRAKSPAVDLERRGLTDRDVLPACYYREDSEATLAALRAYTDEMVDVWYPTADDLAADYELQAWAAEIASDDGARLRGFPGRFERPADLAWVLCEVLFRASGQHAAVNNGQFDRYGWIPYSPTSVMRNDTVTAIAAGEAISEQDFWATLPPRKQCMDQINLVLTLSAPTYTSMMRTGEGAAFAAAHAPRAAAAVERLRRRLSALSGSIRRRNAELIALGRTPYRYLDPYNVSRSIEI